MKWLKLLVGLLLTAFFIRLAVVSLINQESIGFGIDRGSHSNTYSVYGWHAYVMGVGWFGLAVAIFSYCCLGKKLERDNWHKVGYSMGLLLFGISLIVVATLSVIKML